MYGGTKKYTLLFEKKKKEEEAEEVEEVEEVEEGRRRRRQMTPMDRRFGRPSSLPCGRREEAEEEEKGEQ